MMRARWIVLVAAVVAAASTSAAIASPIIDWDPAYFYEPGATFSNSIPGSEMKIVGTISAFGGPLAYLNGNIPGTEYTFFVSGLISQGTLTIGTGPHFYITSYANGALIKIYEDASPDATFAPFPPNEASFQDGTLLLSGTLNGFNTQTNDFTPHQTGNAEGTIEWTGGSLILLLGNGVGGTCPGLFTGGLTWWSDPIVLPPGYLFRHDGKIDDECPTPTRSGTWGRIKTLYR
jgi:hypothetical protein